jgi:hypothetical protein
VAELATTHPEQVWVADITVVGLRQEMVYLAVVMDRFTRSISTQPLRARLPHPGGDRGPLAGGTLLTQTQILSRKPFTVHITPSTQPSSNSSPPPVTAPCPATGLICIVE